MPNFKKKDKPRELTKKEISVKVISHIYNLIDYWDSFEDYSSKEKLDGLAFSILSMLDSPSTDLPHFIVAPATDKEWKKSLIKDGKNYYPDNEKILRKVRGDISGTLHEYYAAWKPDVEEDDK